jgi:WD40 repeat protein
MKIEYTLKPDTKSPARILCIQWHPSFETMLATASFDHDVRIYDIAQNK